MKIFCFDLDGVICTTKKNFYHKSTPKKNVIKMINQLYERNFILIYTSRYMGRNKRKYKISKQRGIFFYFKAIKKMGS